jgi:hypothetical protein
MVKMTIKKPTAAEQYARLKIDRFERFIADSFTDKALKGVELYEVKAESGMVFKCRKLDKTFLANTGSMPMALTEQLINAGAVETDETAASRFAEMSAAEKRAAVEATVHMVLYVCVEPRLVSGSVTNRTDAIAIDYLTMGDLKSLVDWAKGGETASELKTFRRKRK